MHSTPICSPKRSVNNSTTGLTVSLANIFSAFPKLMRILAKSSSSSALCARYCGIRLSNSATATFLCCGGSAFLYSKSFKSSYKSFSICVATTCGCVATTGPCVLTYLSNNLTSVCFNFLISDGRNNIFICGDCIDDNIIYIYIFIIYCIYYVKILKAINKYF